MDADRWERVQALFHAALERPEAERRAFAEAEAGDLAEEVLALLEEDAAGGSLLDRDLAELAHRVLAEPGLRAVGPYQVLGELGRGGMGVVYLAERGDLGHRVAIKVLRDAALSPARRARFAHEERTLARLSHPAIARLYDADALPDGTPYFVMEHVEGVPITDYCAAHPCSVRECLRLFRAVCEAVQAAHRQAIVHRDLKPSNILVTENADGLPQIKLLDFGIAKPLDDLDAKQTQTGLRLMTPAYAAPEQLRGEPTGVYTDVWALGVLLYELLAGRHPFRLEGQTPGQVEAQVLGDEPARPSAVSDRPLGRRAWADLNALCLTAMHKDPELRYPTVEALVRDLGHFLAGRPLDAQPPSVRYQVGKFLRRNRRPVAAAAVVIALVAGIVGFYTVRLAEERNRARAEAAKAEQISDYLIGLFEAGDPYEADSLSVSALLARGALQAEALDGQPAVQAQMLDVLGRVYVLLSRYDRAAPLLREAVALRRRADAPLDLAESLVNLGELYLYTGQNDSAEAVTREALVLRERHLPPRHAELATTLDNLGVVLSRQGDHEAAAAFKRLALQLRRALYDAPHEDLSYSLNNLAVTLYRQGDFSAAEAHYREAIAVDQALYGPDHPEVATALANLGKLLQERGELAPAESLLAEALRIRRQGLGEDHYETALSLSQLGGLLQQKGDFDRAETLLRDALARRERILGPAHSSTASTRTSLAITLLEQGDHAAAEPLLLRVLDDYRTALGEDHWFTGVAYCNLADLLYRKGEADRAEEAYRTGLAVLRAALGTEHPTVAFNESRFGGLLVTQRRSEEAQPILERSYEKLRDHYGPGHRDAHAAAKRLVAFYEAWGQPGEAARFRAEQAEALAASGEE